MPAERKRTAIILDCRRLGADILPDVRRMIHFTNGGPRFESELVRKEFPQEILLK